jgi:2-methylcitrate dehydratase
VSGPVTIDVDAFAGPGVPFKVTQCNMKAYPAVVYAQTAITAGIEVAREVGELHRIAAIEIATTSRGYQAAGSEAEKWAPQNRATADHSLPYTVAWAMADGEVTNATYAPAKLHDPAILAFMRKIKVHEDPALTARMGAAVPTRLTAILEDGRRVTREIDAVPGFAGMPMGRADVERKFRGNVRDRWPPERIDATLQALWRLDNVADISQLLAGLAVRPAP